MKRISKIIICLVLTLCLTLTPVYYSYAGLFGDFFAGEDTDHPIANPSIDASAGNIIDAIGDYVSNIGSYSSTTPGPSTPPGGATPSAGSVANSSGATTAVTEGSSFTVGNIAGTAIKGVGAGVSVFDACVEVNNLINEPITHSTLTGQRIEVGLKTANVCFAVAGAAGAVTALIVGAPLAATAGAGFLAASLLTSIANNYWKGQGGKDFMDFMTGRKRLGFAPLEGNESRKDANDALGFDIYDKSGMLHAQGVSVKKPNIYLYSDTDMSVNISLGNDKLITVSDPVYSFESSRGWKAEIVNGSLNGCEDFLFYEAVVPAEIFDTDNGYLLNSGTLTKDMEVILEATGYSQKEKEDFIDYWSEELDTSKTYLMCPQEEAVINGIMPLYSSKKADSINRYWYYFIEVTDENIHYKNILSLSDVKPITRVGYTIVEWGGMK